MTLQTTFLFLHILGALGLFVGYGFEWAASALLRRASSAEQARAWLRVFRISPPLSGAALLLLILTGGYLAAIEGVMKQGWMSASLVAIVVALGIGFGLILPRTKAIRSALPTGDDGLSADALARLQSPALSAAVRIRIMLALGIVFLMTAKLSLGLSFAALAGAIVLGFLLSLPVLSRPQASASN